MLLIMMGVTAAGKTEVGERLAQRLEWIFADADDYHSQENREKMQAGVPLTDDDRMPWLMDLHDLLDDWEENGINGVLACSALKQQYRELLMQDLPAKDVHFVYLDVPRDVLERRAIQRDHPFMPAGMVASQLDTLEPPQDALKVEVVDAGREKKVDELVNEIIAGLGLHAAQD
jgi:gluconokinase